MEAQLTWNQQMQFTCDNHGLKSVIDAFPEHGGQNAGPTPKELVLNAMMGCTAMDVVSMLNKMRQEIKTFKMGIQAEKTSSFPVHFKTAVISYYLEGNIEPEKLLKAVDSSLSKYCGVNYMISRSCQMSYVVHLNQQELKRGVVNFIEPGA